MIYKFGQNKSMQYKSQLVKFQANLLFFPDPLKILPNVMFKKI